jgi:membrane associated rhomboid family serine protease
LIALTRDYNSNLNTKKEDNMKKRNPIAVLLLPFVTFGIYSLYWMVQTKTEMNAKGATIPTAWLIIIPLVNLWWMWKYSEGVEKVTGGKTSGVLCFILLFLLGMIGSAIVQDSFNKNVA